MGLSRFDSRLSILFLALLISAMIAASAAAAAAQTAPLGDVMQSGSGAGSSGGGNLQGVIISITPIGINRLDVKVQNPDTGNIHSVTLEDDVVKANGLIPGQRVTEYKDLETGKQTLAPTTFMPQGGSLPGQLQGTGDNPSPTDGGNNGGVPPNTGGDNGGVPPPRTGGVTGGGPPTYPPSVPYYPEPKMVGNYIGNGVVNGIPVDIGGPNATPIPANARPGTPITVNNQTGIGNWKQFRGTLQSNRSGYYVEFNQGLYQGYDSNGRLLNGWFPIKPPQSVGVNAG
jgi:hypothetical protein